VIEAKDNNHPVGGGMQQALEYGDTLEVPFVFSSNGDAFLFHDRTGQSNPVEKELTLDEFPSAEDLWQHYCVWKGLTPAQTAVVAQDYCVQGPDKEPRYYQEIAINRTIEAIAKGQPRVLLTMATGTGLLVADAIKTPVFNKLSDFEKTRVIYVFNNNALHESGET
jgi:type I restriction enzyme R subunit